MNSQISNIIKHFPSNNPPSMTEDEQFALLASDGMMVKRPLLITDSTVIPGFKEDLWEAALK